MMEHGRPQEKEDKKETVVKSHYTAFSVEKARKAKNNVLVNCTTTDANHDRATARPNERTNETNERQDQKTGNGTISLLYQSCSKAKQGRLHITNIL